MLMEEEEEEEELLPVYSQDPMLLALQPLGDGGRGIC